MPGEGYVCSLLWQITVTTWSTWTMSKSPILVSHRSRIRRTLCSPMRPRTLDRR
jgi:hypothetical protein